MTTLTPGLDIQQAAPRAVPGVRIPATRMRSRLWLALLALVVIALVVRALLPGQVTVSHPVTKSVRDEAAGTGFVRAKVLVGVGARINGVIVATHVDQGDRVKAGQVMAELQNSDAESQVRQAGHQLSAQRASVISARAGAAAAEARLRAADGTLEKTKAGLRLADLTLERTRSLHESGIASKESLDSAEAAQTAAAREVDAAAGLRAAAAQELAAAAAEAAAAVTLANGSAAAVDVQRANLAYTVVRSPFDGYVIARELEQGATVVPGLPIFTIADPAVRWVSANIDEREIGGLRVGQPATVSLRSNPLRRIPGSVARIAEQADPVTEEVTVDVAFTPTADVVLNETAEVEILKGAKAEALVVPATAIVRGEKGAAVWIVRDGRLQIQAIETGIRDKRGWIEIAGGVAAADFVLVNPSIETVDLSPGKRVRTRRTVAP